VIASVVMTCVSRIATARAWLEPALRDRGHDAATARRILDESTFVSAGATIYVDLHEPPQPLALSFRFDGGTIREVSGLDARPPARPTQSPGEPRSPVSV
jgi:hypothetical protein